MMTRFSLFCLLGGLCCATVDRVPAQDAGTAKFELPVTDTAVPGEGPLRRYDWFKKLWVTKRMEWSRQVAQDQGAVVFLGDSITQGWESMARDFPGMKVANRGISGDTTRGMLLRMKEDVLSLNPRAVVLLMGTNDLEEKAEPSMIAANLKRIIAELKKSSTTMPIILCQVFPSSASKARPAEKIKEINKLYAEAVKGDRQITLVETWHLFADPQGDAKSSEFPDLLHPNKVGYMKWASALRPIFATFGYLETAPDAFKPEEGFVSLFNGQNLNGWCFRNKDGAELQRFDEKTASSDGRYVALNGRLIVTTPAEGSKLAQLWTTREFPKDFILKLEFRATPNADSGVFLRKPQLQCRDYLVAGPYKSLKHYKPQDWNELVIEAKGGSAVCTCNGEPLETEFKLPATGPIGLEGDRGQMEYRRIRIKESP